MAPEPSRTPDSPGSPSTTHSGEKAKKKSSDSSNSAAGAAKITKRRAARACVSCRARKVRCDVVEGAPCGNCRWDNVECVVQESRRRKKHLHAANNGAAAAGQGFSAEAQLRSKGAPSTNPITISSSAYAKGNENVNGNANMDANRRPSSGSAMSDGSVEGQQRDASEGYAPQQIFQRPSHQQQDTSLLGHLPPTIPASTGEGDNPLPSFPSIVDQASALGGDARTTQFLNSLEDHDANAHLPAFVRPLPSKLGAEDISYLRAKGALTLPPLPLQNALLQGYLEYVHPYMPLMDVHDFLGIVNSYEGLNGQTSLFLYHAVMFSATAFVDMKHLRKVGYTTRKAARKAFFHKTRLLYDFDYELDRLVLVQGLLLMTYWYETPDDQKDTWHWMGVAISLAHTIGLHRNPEVTSMSPNKQKLWKRIWWSCFMRDRLIALGMRRPTRIKDEDFDVPMLQEADFEIRALSDHVTVVPPQCTLLRDVEMQKELATMCVQKARLCLCISHMLRAQYSVLIRDNMKPENTTNSTMMLFPNKEMDNVENVNTVDQELMAWAESLPTSCQYRTLTPMDLKGGKSTMAVQRTLLHMVYYTTISALHRPQFLPSSPLHTPTTSRQVQEMSRLRVRDAAMHITRMATELHQLRLERFLPTTGVTVILPAMIIHLLEMKNPSSEARERATRGFRQCMRVMEKLREIYAAADYATGFLDAALRKAGININANIAPSTLAMMKQVPLEFSAQTPPPDNLPYMTASESMFNEKRPVQAPTVLPPNTVNAAALEMPATSPPTTDFDPSAGVVTPSASGGSEEANPEPEAMDLDLDFMQGHDAFDWNAVAGTDFDVDQWLQFPQDLPTNSDDMVFTEMMANNNEVQVSAQS